jgi:aryl-phospho-beta-D-glucosidase BglC (GH1 family)
VRIRSINKIGVEATVKKWRSHWSNAVTESDFKYLTTVARCTTIRLPIGYFTLGPCFSQHTPFAMSPSQIYITAWSAVINLVHRCFAHGIGVILDLHACPGGANAETHSGTSSGQAELWGDAFNLEVAKSCLCAIAAAIRGRGLEGVVGIQLCNEAGLNAHGMYDWYDEVISAISTYDNTIPIYISDAWELVCGLRYAMRENNTSSMSSINPVIVDTHRCYDFSSHDTSKSAIQIIDQISFKEFRELDSCTGNVFERRSAVGVFVGEWSYTLSPLTWAQAGASQREVLMKELGQAQARRWRGKGPSAGGGAFWTYRAKSNDKESTQRQDWDFREQVNKWCNPCSFLVEPYSERSVTESERS